MNGFLKSQQEMKFVIDIYVGDHLASDIRQIIHKYLIHYHWKSRNLFDCTHEEFQDVILSCSHQIFQKPVHNPDKETKLLQFLRKQRMNGAIFCSLSKSDWMALLKTDDICSMGVAINLWKTIYRFDFAVIVIGSRMYLLNEAQSN